MHSRLVLFFLFFSTLLLFIFSATKFNLSFPEKKKKRNLIKESWPFCLFDFIAEIPDNEYIKYFAPDYSLKIQNGNIVRQKKFLGNSCNNLCMHVQEFTQLRSRCLILKFMAWLANYPPNWVNSRFGDQLLLEHLKNTLQGYILLFPLLIFG